MKHRRRRLSRSTIRKYGAEFDQRLREHFEQERQGRFFELRYRLLSILMCLLFCLFAVLVGFFPKIFASLIWYAAHTTSERRLSEHLESSILVAEGLFAAAQCYISIITLSVLTVLYGVIYRFEQKRWTRIFKFWYWLLVSLLGLLFCLFTVMSGLRQTLDEQIQQAIFVAFVERLSEQLGISFLVASVLLAAIPFYISIVALGVRAYRLSRGKDD